MAEVIGVPQALAAQSVLAASALALKVMLVGLQLDGQTLSAVAVPDHGGCVR
jgi:hypothetical protein